MMLHIRTKRLRVILGALAGAMLSLAVFLPFYTKLLSVLYRVLTALLIILISFGKCRCQQLLVRTGAFLFMSMLLCGGVICIELMFDPVNVAVINDTVYFDISPAVLIITTLAVYFCLNVYSKLRDRHKLNCSVRKITVIMQNNSKLCFEAAVDTGCTLKEPFSGDNVILAEEEIFKSTDIPTKSTRVIPYSTVSGEGLLVAFRPEKVLIDNKELNCGCYIALCKDKLKGEIKSLIGKELSEAV